MRRSCRARVNKIGRSKNNRQKRSERAPAIDLFVTRKGLALDRELVAEAAERGHPESEGYNKHATWLRRRYAEQNSADSAPGCI